MTKMMNDISAVMSLNPIKYIEVNLNRFTVLPTFALEIFQQKKIINVFKISMSFLETKITQCSRNGYSDKSHKKEQDFITFFDFTIVGVFL